MKLLERHFEMALAAPDGIKKLRELILTLAMQGKLVPQDPSDQPASELLKEIEAEKRRLVKEGKLKKQETLPPIKPEQVPYEVPAGWEWVRLGAFTEIIRGITFPANEKTKEVAVGRIACLRTSNVQETIQWDDMLHIDRSFMKHDYQLVNKNDIIMSMAMLEDEVKATTDHFSDGQFQSVYIYSIIEIFKDRNCLTLLDEPDSFLHPEWQFDFLKQVFAIAESDVAKNHVLMSSHSASTITSSKERTLNLFEIKENRVEVSKVSKKEIILALSNGSIKLSEDESIMSINAFLRNNKEPVLFTEGISDECILETAWEKLFPSERRCFCIHSAFDRQFLRNLCIREELRNNNPGRLFFALFDFDDAVDDWKQIGKIDVITDPYHGLVKKHSGYDLFACLLPVPQNETIKQQVFKPGTTLHWDAGKDCHLTIELLFYGLNETTSYYKTTDQSCGGKMIVFSGDKVKFAEEVIPKLPKAAFEIFRPMFEFIKTKCSSASVGPEQSSSGESAAKA